MLEINDREIKAKEKVISNVFGYLHQKSEESKKEKLHIEKLLATTSAQTQLDDLYQDVSQIPDIEYAKSIYTQKSDEIYKGIYKTLSDNNVQKAEFNAAVKNYAHHHLYNLTAQEFKQKQNLHEYHTSEIIEKLIEQSGKAAQEGNSKQSLNLANQAHGVVIEAVKTGLLTPEQAVHKHEHIKDTPIVNHYVAELTNKFANDNHVGAIDTLKELAANTSISSNIKSKIYIEGSKLRKIYTAQENYNKYITDKKIREIEFKVQNGEEPILEDLKLIPKKRFQELNDRISTSRDIRDVVQPAINSTPSELAEIVNELKIEHDTTKDFSKKETLSKSIDILKDRLSSIKDDPYNYIISHKDSEGTLVLQKKLKDYMAGNEFARIPNDQKDLALKQKKIELISDIGQSLEVPPAFMSKNTAKIKAAELNNLSPHIAVKAIKKLESDYGAYSDDMVVQLEKEGLKKLLRIGSMIDEKDLNLYGRAMDNADAKVVLKAKEKQKLWNKVIESSDKYVKSLYGAYADSGDEAGALQNSQFLLAQQIQKEELIDESAAAKKAYDKIIGNKYKFTKKSFFDKDYMNSVRYPVNIDESKFKDNLENYIKKGIENNSIWFYGYKDIQHGTRELKFNSCNIKPLPDNSGVFILIEGNPVWTKNNKLYTMTYSGAINE